MPRRFQFSLLALFLLTTAVGAAIVSLVYRDVFGLSRLETAVVAIVFVLLFGSKLDPRHWLLR